MNELDPVFEPLPIPSFFNANRVGEIWRVNYQQRADEAIEWAKNHRITPAAQDKQKIALVLVDVQNTFCIPGFELFVGGRSGIGAVEDNRRLCEFIYRHLNRISLIVATMDTHRAFQIFHPIMFINEKGEHPAPMTSITLQDVRDGKWRFNPAAGFSIGISAEQGQEQLLHYVTELARQGKFDLTIWPYHAMLGGIGHALVPAVEEALFFHTIARQSQVRFEIKGDAPLTENYSAIRPEVLSGAHGEKVGRENPFFMKLLKNVDAILVAGQAKSHCVNWTLEDWLKDIQKADVNLAKKIYILEDCMSPVVIPGVVDYTNSAEEAFARYAAAGMHRVRAVDPIQSWLKLGN
ncbi:MAG: isochorismatase [Anaerolineales bacterium]